MGFKEEIFEKIFFIVLFVQPINIQNVQGPDLTYNFYNVIHFLRINRIFDFI